MPPLGEEFSAEKAKKGGSGMKRKSMWLRGLIMIMVMAMLGVGAAWAGQFPDQDAKMAAAKARSVAANQRAVAEKKEIAEKYAKADLERQAAARALAVKPAASEGGLPGPVKTLILAPFTTVGTGLMALGEGFKYVTNSPLENPISRVSRAVNTAKSQLLYYPVGVATEFFTGFTANPVKMDPSKLNYLGERAKQRGPVAQMAEMAANVIPPVAASTGIVAPVLGMTVPEMAITTGVVSAVGGIAVGEAFDYGEKKLLK